MIKASFKKLALRYCTILSALSFLFWVFIFLGSLKYPEFGKIGMLDFIPCAIVGIVLMIFDAPKALHGNLLPVLLFGSVSLLFWNGVGLVLASFHLMIKDK